MTVEPTSVLTARRWIRFRTSEREARAWFERIRLGWQGRLWRRLVRSSRTASRSARLQLTGLPCAEVSVGLSGVPETPGGLQLRIWGHAQGVERVRDPSVVEPEGEPAGRAFDYPLTEAATLELARRALTRLKLSRMLGPHALRDLSVVITGVYYYPFWVGYYERRARWVDVVMLDAVTGRGAGSLMRRGLLDALAARRDSQRD